MAECIFSGLCGSADESLVSIAKLPTSHGHGFYDVLADILRDGKIDRFAESLCEPFHEECGHPVPCFRLIFVGFFEEIEFQRAGVDLRHAWRCGDELSLQKFLRYEVHESSLDHSSMSPIHTLAQIEGVEIIGGDDLRRFDQKHSGETFPSRTGLAQNVPDAHI